MRILTGELEGECWEDHLKISAVLKVSRAEETGPEPSIRERLGNGVFSGPSEAVQPEDTLTPVTCESIFDILEDALPRFPQTLLSVPTEVPGIRSMVQSIGRDLPIPTE